MNVFGSDSFKRQICELVKLKLHGSGEVIEIVAFHTICSPLLKAVNLNQYPCLQ